MLGVITLKRDGCVLASPQLHVPVDALNDLHRAFWLEEVDDEVFDYELNFWLGVCSLVLKPLCVHLPPQRRALPSESLLAELRFIFSDNAPCVKERGVELLNRGLQICVELLYCHLSQVSH